MWAKIVWTLVALFFVFYVIAQPESAAESTQSLFTIIGLVFHSLLVFLTRLAN